MLFAAILVVIVLTALLALIGVSTTLNYIIPTPFSKKPFEFMLGFRKTFYVFPLAYLLAIIAVYKGNFNLGLFAIIVVALVCFNYYSKLENEYFVWNFSLSPKEFLLQKIKACLLNFTLLSLPILVALSVFFFIEIEKALLALLLCYPYLITMVLSKYTTFPSEINFSKGIIIGVCFIFPPVLLAVIPMFYSQSTKSLNTIL